MSKVENVDENQPKTEGADPYAKVPMESEQQQPPEENQPKEKGPIDLNDSDVGSIKGDPNAELKKKLMFGEKDISVLLFIRHLSEPIDVVYVILGTIGAIGSGIAMPIIAYL